MIREFTTWHARYHTVATVVHGAGRALLSLCIDVARWYRSDEDSTPGGARPALRESGPPDGARSVIQP